MPTTVVNLRAIPDIRPDDVYIGRASSFHVVLAKTEGNKIAGFSGCFGNPFHGEGTREEHVAQFRAYAIGRVEHDTQYRERVASLHGRRLLCFCAPKSCHGDVLAELADQLHEEEAAAAWEEHQLCEAEAECARAEFLEGLCAAMVAAGAQEIELPEPDDGLDRCLFCGGAKYGDDPMLSECTCIIGPSQVFRRLLEKRRDAHA